MSGTLRLLADGALALVGIRRLEEPAFRVIDRPAEGIEVRAYGARLAAQTVVQARGPWEARREGFRRLARYIFRGNARRASIAMTMPVASAEADDGTPLVMRFFLPTALARDGAPPPSDPAVRLVQLPPAQVAALRWPGGIDPAQARAAEARLIRLLEGTRWQPVAPPESWFYDPPSTPAPLRRNEATVTVAPRG
jgi:hypothetical protein